MTTYHVHYRNYFSDRVRINEVEARSVREALNNTLQRQERIEIVKVFELVEVDFE